MFLPEASPDFPLILFVHTPMLLPRRRNVKPHETPR
jgi:hypothetical protein